MAEAAVVIGLVASIASLIDLSTKVAARIHEFGEKASDVLVSFAALSVRLPLLTSSLKVIPQQAQADRLLHDCAPSAGF